MRKILREQVQMGEMDIATVPIGLDSRDEIPQLLRGLQHLDRVPDYGLEGFERYVALAIVARNVHLLGSKLQEMELAALEYTRRRAA